MKGNFFTLLIVALATTCCMSFASKHSGAKVKQTSSPMIVVDGYYVDGSVTVHIDANNNDLALYGSPGGSASVTGNTITLTGFTQYFYWTDHTIGFTHYDGDLIPE